MAVAPKAKGYVASYSKKTGWTVTRLKPNWAKALYYVEEMLCDSATADEFTLTALLAYLTRRKDRESVEACFTDIVMFYTEHTLVSK
jgi:hypothetical protein